MKYKKLIIIALIFAAALALIMCIEGKDKEIIEEHKIEEQQKVSTPTEKEQSNVLYTADGLKIEVISCNAIEDSSIEIQEIYKAEFFYNGKLPDEDYKEEFIDYEAIKAVCPELRDLWERSASYSVTETKEIYNRNLDVIEEHTTMRHPKTTYYFVNCKITNTSGKANKCNVDTDVFISSPESEYLELQECSCYFDHAVYTEEKERTQSFFLYPFKKDETIECVIGFAVKKADNEASDYYMGVQRAGVDMFTKDNTQLVPLETVSR